MRKSPDAFRTISEVAQELDLPQHVLRFWETRFSQIKPMKRGGGRRYYRPDDVELLRGIRHLLYGEGYTIKGVQRILKEQGIRHVIEAFPGHIAVSDGEAEQQSVAQPQPPIANPQHGYDKDQLRTGAETNALSGPSVESDGKAPHEEQQPPMVASKPERLPVHATNPPAPAPVPSAPAMAAITASPEISAPVAPDIPPQAVNAAHGYGAPERDVELPTQTKAPVSSSPQSPPPVTGPNNVQAPSPEAAGIDPQGMMSAPAHIMMPQIPQMPQPIPTSGPAPSMPAGLTQGEPVYQQGQEAAFSVETGRNSLLQDNKSGFFSRLRGKHAESETDAKQEQTKPASMPRDDVRRLQSTLFELLECKRILDQARNSS